MVWERPGRVRVLLTHRSDTPPKDDPCPKPAENRKQVQTLSGLFGSAPIRRSEIPADKKKQLSSKTHQGAVSPPDLLLEDMISLEDFQSNSQDAEMCKVRDAGCVVWVRCARGGMQGVWCG